MLKNGPPTYKQRNVIRVGVGIRRDEINKSHLLQLLVANAYLSTNIAAEYKFGRNSIRCHPSRSTKYIILDVIAYLIGVFFID